MWEWISKWEWLLKAFAWIRKLFTRSGQNMSEEGTLELEQIKAHKRAVFHEHYDILIGMAIMASVFGFFSLAEKVVEHYFPPVIEQQENSNDIN